jgi:hypothetical protein
MQALEAGWTTMAARAELKALLSATGLCLALAMASPAHAQSSCEADIGKMQQKRMGIIEGLNKLQQKDQGKLDPIEACPRLRSLAGIEKEIQAYMEKNQSWCNIPDEAVTNIKDTQVKTTQIAGQACNIAAQIKKQQQQQAQGGGMPGFAAPAPKLPSGPL